ncbi:GNAT family N-acetyltransferase [Paraburkholderia acidisoli]|uniref:GNAT family N-acetyltransferase n=1 Tax=Paraburkholderia acidisoli TaxID=2571748 RepID=A0A7Z2JI10_9BURK|nr:GNAT family N-acetyltransferase [Paraburkholderia acidisoli]QGZ66427.1 GNAT family N-acetyltransferase [Paraburkholderia acidisoli]
MATPVLTPDALDASSTSLRSEVRRCESLDAFRALEAQWLALVAAPDARSPFTGFDYAALAAARAFANGATLEVACVYDAHELVVMWPVSIAREGVLRTARHLSCGSGEEYGGPLIKDTRRADLYAAAVGAIRRIHADVLDVPMLEHGSALSYALDAAPRAWAPRWLPERARVMPGYAIGLRAYVLFDDFLATRPAAFRSALRYSARRLAKTGAVSCSWCTNVEDTQNVLTWLFANKREWAQKRAIDTPYLLQDDVRDFFLALAARVDLACTPLVACVKVDGKPVAASINLVGAQQVEYFITTYDEAFSTHSPGNLLVEFVARWAQEHQLDFDFRPLHGDYKARWSNRQTRHETRVIVLGLRGRCVEIKLLWAQAKRVARKLTGLISRRADQVDRVK